MFFILLFFFMEDHHTMVAHYFVTVHFKMVGHLTIPTNSPRFYLVCHSVIINLMKENKVKNVILDTHYARGYEKLCLLRSP